MIKLKTLLLERLWDDSIGSLSKQERGNLRASLRYAYQIHDNAKAWNVKISYDLSQKNVEGQIRALKPLPPSVKEAFEEAGKTGSISKKEMEQGRRDADRQANALTKLSVRTANAKPDPISGGMHSLNAIFSEADNVLATCHSMLDYLTRRKKKKVNEAVAGNVNADPGYSDPSMYAAPDAFTDKQDNDSRYPSLNHAKEAIQQLYGHIQAIQKTGDKAAHRSIALQSDSILQAMVDAHDKLLSLVGDDNANAMEVPPPENTYDFA